MDKTLQTIAMHGAALLARLTLGQAFLMQGWSKLSDMEAATRGFSGMGVPLPQASALGAGVIELVGGALLILGMWTRGAATALLAVMVAALLLVHAGQFGSALATPLPAPGGGLVAIPAWMHLLPLLFLAGFGGGAISLSTLKDSLGKGGGKPAAAGEGKKPKK
jgi:putative oxidoreductase